MKKYALLAGLFLAASAHADVTVKDSWVRGTVAGQKATGAFMELTSDKGEALVSAASPVAGVVEIHTMKMEGDVMKMRAIPRLDLPAGKAVALTPGGYHVMLMELKKPLQKGEVVPITLRFEGADKKVQEVTIKAEVRELAAGAKKEMQHNHGGMKH